MANRAFRRMVEQRRAYLNYRSPVLDQYEEAVERVENVEEVPVNTQVPLPSWNPEKEVLDNLRSIWYNFKQAENKEERDQYLKVVDKILSK